jgi:hypothetical protein
VSVRPSRLFDPFGCCGASFFSFQFVSNPWAHALAHSLACPILQVDDACPLATMAALSFNAKQAQKAEWYTDYPKVRLTGSALPKHDAVVRRRAKALPPPPPPPLLALHNNEDDDPRAVQGTGTGILRHLNAREFSAFAAITCGAIGSDRAAMSMISDVALKELKWQLHVMQPQRIGFPLPKPMPIVLGEEDKAAAESERRRSSSSPISASRVRTRALSPELVASSPGMAADVQVPATHLDIRRDHMAGKKRKRSATTEVAEAPDSPTPPPPQKRVKRGSGTQNRGHFEPHLYHRGRSDRRGTRSTRNNRNNAQHHEEESLKPPAGPAAAFLYALGMQSATEDCTRRQRERGAGKWR